MKTKTSPATPPDPDPSTQAIKRVHIQVFIWLKFRQEMIDTASYGDNGWRFDPESDRLRASMVQG